MRTRPVGKLSIQEAIATLVQTQAAFVSEMAEINRRHVELKLESDRRFAAIEEVLRELVEAVQQLPEAIRQKIGFKQK